MLLAVQALQIATVAEISFLGCVFFTVLCVSVGEKVAFHRAQNEILFQREGADHSLWSRVCLCKGPTLAGAPLNNWGDIWTCMHCNGVNECSALVALPLLCVNLEQFDVVTGMTCHCTFYITKGSAEHTLGIHGPAAFMQQFEHFWCRWFDDYPLGRCLDKHGQWVPTRSTMCVTSEK